MSDPTFTLYLADDTLPEKIANFIFLGENALYLDTLISLNRHLNNLLGQQQFPITSDLPTWSKHRVAERRVYLVAHHNQRYVGFIRLEWDGIVTHSYPDFHIPGAPYYLFVTECYVEPKCRHQGVATTMLNEVLKIARYRHYRGVVLSVSADNWAAQRCYYKFGFYPLETQWYGTPKTSTARTITPEVLPATEAIRSKRFRKLLTEHIYRDSQRWSVLAAYRKEIQAQFLRQIEELNLPVLLFNRGNYGATAMAEVLPRQVLSGFPTIFTPAATAQTEVLKACWKSWAKLGQKYYHINAFHYATLQPVDLSATGLSKTYFVLVYPL